MCIKKGVWYNTAMVVDEARLVLTNVSQEITTEPSRIGKAAFTDETAKGPVDTLGGFGGFAQELHTKHAPRTNKAQQKTEGGFAQ